MPRFHVVLFLLTATLLTACATGPTTVINLPPLPGDTANHDANSKTVVEATTAALQNVLKNWPADGPYAVSLPRGANQATYDAILKQLPAGGAVVLEDPKLPVYKVARLRIRGWNGQVDIIKPGIAGTPDQLVSVYLSVDTKGWYTVRNRLWRLPVEKALEISADAFDLNAPASPPAENRGEEK